MNTAYGTAYADHIPSNFLEDCVFHKVYLVHSLNTLSHIIKLLILFQQIYMFFFLLSDSSSVSVSKACSLCVSCGRFF